MEPSRRRNMRQVINEHRSLAWIQCQFTTLKLLIFVHFVSQLLLEGLEKQSMQKLAKFKNLTLKYDLLTLKSL